MGIFKQTNIFWHGTITVLIILITTAFVKLKPKYKLIINVIACVTISFVIYNAYLITPKTNTNVISISNLESTINNAENPILVEVTADWCITCQFNKRTVLQNVKVKRFLNQNNITHITLDWTNRNPEILRYLQSFDRIGVPTYIYYQKNKQPTLLPELIRKSDILNLPYE